MHYIVHKWHFYFFLKTLKSLSTWGSRQAFIVNQLSKKLGLEGQTKTNLAVPT